MHFDPRKAAKMDDIVLMLQGAMAAEGKVGLMMNVLTCGIRYYGGSAVAVAAGADGVVADRSGLGGGEYDRRGAGGAPHRAAAQGGGSPGDRGVSVE